MREGGEKEPPAQQAGAQKAHPGKPERAVGRKGIYKPGSVADNDLSRPPVAMRLKPPFGTRRAAALFQLVLLRIGFTWRCGLPHPGGLLPRLSTLTIRGWRYLSVALSLESPRPAVSRYPALWSPDFPHDAVSGIPPLSNSLSYVFYCTGKWAVRQEPPPVGTLVHCFFAGICSGLAQNEPFCVYMIESGQLKTIPCFLPL